MPVVRATSVCANLRMTAEKRQPIGRPRREPNMTKKSLALLATPGLIWLGLCGCAAMFITREVKILEERANDLHEDLLGADLALSKKARDALLKAVQDLAEARDDLDDLTRSH